MSTRLTCDRLGGGTIEIELAAADAERVQAACERERRPGRHALGEFHEVTDQLSGDRFEIASAPCGLGCHCALLAKRTGPSS